MKIIKKLITYTIISAIIFTLLSGMTVFASGTQIAVSSPSCRAGEEVSVEISIPVNAGLVSLLLEINFDDALTLTEVVDGEILGEDNHSDNLCSPFILSWENDEIKENLTSTGKLATLKFRVNADAEIKKYPISITRSELLDKDINDVACSITDGGVVVNDTVSLDITAVNGTTTGAGTYKKGTSVTVTATPGEGYKFVGWYVAEQSVSTNSTYTFTINDDTKLTAKFSSDSPGGGGGGGGAPSYTVKFETNGGNAVPNQSLNAKDNLVKFVAPTKEGYVFDGWHTDKELTIPYDFETKVTKSFTLYAKWIKAEETIPDEKEYKITYNDVKENDWFYNYVSCLTEKHIVSGDGTGNFAPNDNVTREQFLKMLIEATGIKISDTSNTFADVDNNAWYKDYVLTAKNSGIVNGISEDKFGIGVNISRQDMAVMISRTIQTLDIDVVKQEVEPFTDSVKVSEYANDSVVYMKSIGLIEGYNNEYRPLDNLTRAEATKVIYELLEKII